VGSPLKTSRVPHLPPNHPENPSRDLNLYVQRPLIDLFICAGATHIRFFGFGFASWFRFKSVIIELNYAGAKHEMRGGRRRWRPRSIHPSIHLYIFVQAFWPHPHPQPEVRQQSSRRSWSHAKIIQKQQQPSHHLHPNPNPNPNPHLHLQLIGCEVFIEFAAKTPTWPMVKNPKSEIRNPNPKIVTNI